MEHLGCFQFRVIVSPLSTGSTDLDSTNCNKKQYLKKI